MKKKLLILVFACSISSFVTSQETEQAVQETLSKKHELRLGALKLLSAGIFEATYEYVQDSNRGFGATVLINLDTGNEYIENYSLTPFYRMYFQTKEDYGAKGFFVEGFASFFGGKNYDSLGIGRNSNDNFFDTSIGLSLGKKWINSAGFVFELKLGAGRNLFNGSEYDALIKGDIYIGYRF